MSGGAANDAAGASGRSGVTGASGPSEASASPGASGRPRASDTPGAPVTSDAAASFGTSSLSDTAGASGPSVSSGRRGRIAGLICWGLPAVLLAAVIAVPAALWSRLPGRVADHWTIGGTANGTAPRLVPFVVLGVVAVVGAGIVALAWVLARSGVKGPGRAAGAGPGTGLTGIGLFVTTLNTGLVVMVAVASLDGGGPGAASVGAGVLPGIVAGSLALAALAGYALRRYGGLGAADGGAPRPGLGLRPGERAVWSGRARATWPWPAGSLLIVAGVVAGVVTGRWVLTVVLPLVGVLMLGLTSVRVTVAARGVTVGYGALGLRLTRIPLRRIASAAAVNRLPSGFGYRGSLLLFGAAAVVLRRGPALRLTLRDGKTFLVTVDDAETGAALLNDLVGSGGTGASGP